MAELFTGPLGFHSFLQYRNRLAQYSVTAIIAQRLIWRMTKVNYLKTIIIDLIKEQTEAIKVAQDLLVMPANNALGEKKHSVLCVWSEIIWGQTNFLRNN